MRLVRTITCSINTNMFVSRKQLLSNNKRISNPIQFKYFGSEIIKKKKYLKIIKIKLRKVKKIIYLALVRRNM